MFTCKIKVGAEWILPKHPRQVDKQIKKGLRRQALNFNGRKMNNVKAIKELLKDLKKQYKTIEQKEEGNYIIIRAY